MARITADMAGVAIAPSVENRSLTPCDWIMTIFGPAVNPHVTIGTNMIELTGTIPDGAHAVIDSHAKTITLTTKNGQTTSIFDWGVRGTGENGGHYVFQRIPAGTHPVTFPSSFRFDLQPVYERSDPSWKV